VKSYVILVLAAMLGITGSARALAPDELLLLTNSTNPASDRCAQFYAKARLVPDGRILSLAIPNNDEISFEQYEREVVPAVRGFLRKNGLQDKVKCIVTFFGVPLRIAGHKPTPDEQKEMGEIRQQFDQAVQKAGKTVEEAEGLAKLIDPKFQGEPGGGPETFGARANRALGSVVAALGTDRGTSTFIPRAQRLIVLTSAMAGDSEVLRQFSDEDLKKIAANTTNPERWTTRRTEIQAAQGEVKTLQELRFDPEARKRLREVVPEDFGAFGTLNLLRSELEYLTNDGTAAAFDNELALLWWDFYPRSSSLLNPLHHKFHGRPAPPVVMTMRLDAPQEAIVANIILTSLRAEKDGLTGRFAIDATGGLDLNGKVDKRGGYSAFDAHLMNLATQVRANTKMPLTLDQKATLFPPNSVKDVALYAGWYSVRSYIPFATFKPGAVAVHIASYECISLHLPEEKGWCAGLLNDGAAATMGAVAEPYLDAFPFPDEFFPLLMTGKPTLAECYWSTLPQVSWMMTCIGDPLYRPFAKSPQMKITDLPEQLRVLFVPTGGTAEAPVGGGVDEVRTGVATKPAVEHDLGPRGEKPHGEGVLHP
jgi:uncharacterized protein (TIGR03790 family)